MRLVLGILIGISLACGVGTAAIKTRIITVRNGDAVFTANQELACYYSYGTTTVGTIVCESFKKPSGYSVGINKQWVTVSLGNRFVYKHRCC